MIDIDRAMSYLRFVQARHEAFEARLEGKPQPWTDEPIVATRKFTNVYRVLDYGSQFVVTDLADPDISEVDQLARLFLYRYTNLPSTWLHVRNVLGRYPLASDMGPELVQIIHDWRDVLGQNVFSGAYVILPQPNTPGDKVEQAVELTARMFTPGGSDSVVDAFFSATTQAGRFAALRKPKGVGDFMAMQVLTDWGYTAQCGVDRENEFIILGPGARKGALALDPKAKPERTFEWAVQAVHNSPGCPTVQGRKPSLMDIQNTLCEFSKWVRFEAKPLPVKPYRPNHRGKLELPVLPRHWL